MSYDLTERILHSLNREVLNQLELAKTIAHPAESGRAREQVLADFLRKLVPRSYGISTGFIVDAVGGISKQIDLVIFRSDYHPIFQIGGIKHFPVEAVAIVIENKASITDTQTLLQALENIRSVKVLDRTNRGRNYVLIGSQRGPMVDPHNFQHQIFGAILTEQSLSQETLAHQLLNFIRANERDAWPNLYADVRHFLVKYLKSVDPATGTVIPNGAEFLAISDNADQNFVPPLIELAYEIMNFLRVAPLIDYSPSDYLVAGRGKINWWRI